MTIRCAVHMDMGLSIIVSYKLGVDIASMPYNFLLSPKEVHVWRDKILV